MTNQAFIRRDTRPPQRRWIAALSVGLLSSIAAAQASDGAARLAPDIDKLIAANYAGVEAMYKDIHAHPELALEEVNTAKKLATAMRELGFEVTEGVGKTGVVAMLRNGAGPMIMVRTELDALPMEEKTGLPYASKVKTIFAGKETFVAHSCGHDIHMAAWVGTARTLVALKDKWHGTLMFIAQPAEEILGGAKPMLADLALQKNRQLLQAWREVSPKLEAMLGTSSCAAMLTDATGVLVGARCAARAHEELMPVATRVGVNLSEEAVGTTAPGVVARTGKAVSVIGADHFFDSVKGMHCAAAPIRDITGSLAGVLDLSSELMPFAFDAAAVTGLYAGEIENRLLVAGSDDHLVIRFQVAEALLDSALVALIGVDTHGRLQCENGAARSLLGTASSSLEANRADIEGSLGLRLTQLTALPSVGSALLTLPNGLLVHARADMRSPDGQRNFITVSRPIEADTAAAVSDSANRRASAIEAVVAEPIGSDSLTVIPPNDAKITLRAFDRELIQRTLRASADNVSEAARSLGVSRNFIYRRLRQVEAQAA